MATAAGVERTAEVPNMEGGSASDKADERKDKDKEEEQEQSKKAGEEGKEEKKERTRYSVELTVEVVVEGALSMMDLLKGIQKQCGTVDSGKKRPHEQISSEDEGPVVEDISGGFGDGREGTKRGEEQEK
ncbi:hypothetical protein CgunFtcFv8_015631 [Champsocephalus gunnari]|uniref:Uncharacterized protein n=1 Tax=Champsocephalus gunnari TaxID=52237 RepID=A0AAN8H0X1_CHAGU|nr:hypothetical protein CgunFtcFv8_015631 [Champsocephalus gunnari]